MNEGNLKGHVRKRQPSRGDYTLAQQPKCQKKLHNEWFYYRSSHNESGAVTKIQSEINTLMEKSMTHQCYMKMASSMINVLQTKCETRRIKTRK